MIDAKRLELMTRGTEELEVWLLDIFREGVAVLEAAPADYWATFSARMVDAKLSAIGRRIRTWPEILSQQDGARRIVEEVADLYLYVQAFKRINQLPPLRQLDLLTAGGVTQKKETIKAAKGIQDHWLVIGQKQGEEENLKYRRTWLLGESTENRALLLDFAWGREDFAEQWTVGSVFSGIVVYYPSNYPQRALVKSLEWSKRPYDMPAGDEEIQAMLFRFTKAWKDNPWLFSFPAQLNNCLPVFQEKIWSLIDKYQRIIRLADTPGEYWDLLALSAGKPLHLFGEWENSQFLPLSSWHDNRLIPLTK